MLILSTCIIRFVYKTTQESNNHNSNYTILLATTIPTVNNSKIKTADELRECNEIKTHKNDETMLENICVYTYMYHHLQ